MKTIFFIILTALLCVANVPAAEPVATAWVQRYNGHAESQDYARTMAIDSSGNVIVAGTSDAGFSGGDWLIIKYSNAGVPLWTNRYNSSGNGQDRANAVAVDGSGNVFVTGSSAGSGSDYATIKYSGTGVPLWTNRYHGSGNGFDEATALAVDGSGNVFVTGVSDWGYVTIAYSGAGAPLWTNRYDAENSSDYATAVAVDSSGNVFVTGDSDDGSGYYNYATVAYSGAGVPLWTNRYGAGYGDDHARAVAVDNGGNVFVTGDSAGPCSSVAYATIAYSGAGVPLWTNRYNGLEECESVSGETYDVPTAMAVDSGGNVFVTGRSVVSETEVYDEEDGYEYIFNTDYVTIKYSGAGVALWTNRYNRAGNYYDEATALAVDSSDNVFVTGSSTGGDGFFDYATIKYSGEGVPLWTNRYDAGFGFDEAAAVAVDSSGNVFITGSSAGNGRSSDYATIAYSSAGVLLWTNRYNGSANASDGARVAVVDGSGNVFVGGSSSGNGSSSEYAIIAYSSAGLPLWTNRSMGPGSGSHYLTAMAVDASGNVFVTGDSDGGNVEYATIKYSGAGVALWTNRYGGGSYSFSSAMAVDGGGNVFVTGSAEGVGGYNYATIKYSGAGVPLWTNSYNGLGSNDYSSDLAKAVAVDSSGNVFVTGASAFWLPSGGGQGYATIKYSGAGVPLWTNRYHGGNQWNFASATAVDGNGNVFVTGKSLGSGVHWDYATIKYSGAGVPLWTNRYDSGYRYIAFNSHPSGEASAIAVDGSGNVIVTGRTTGSNESSDYATIKYSGAGMPLWTNHYHGPGNSDNGATAVAVDGSGNVFVTGQSAGSGSGDDYATIKYSGAGVPLWTNRYNGPANGNDSMSYYDLPHKQSLALGPDGSVYVTGTSDGDYSGSAIGDFATIKYVSVPALAIHRSAADVIVSWPSPFSDFTLQQNTDGLATTNWSNVPASVQDDGTHRAVTVSPPNGNRFYRLYKP